ncbi:hypothetical protein JCM10295v2_002236 [Rhodotorula toruloides]
MARSSSSGTSPAPPDQDRLAQLEALLAESLFSTRKHPQHAPEDTGSRPVKRKKTEQDGEAAQDASEAGALAGDGAVAFRLFSTQKTPQKVVIREAESPEPVVRDPRIRKSPFAVPCTEDDAPSSSEKDPSQRPPERPHDGLIARRPFEGVYAQGRGEGKKERMPRRNEVMRLRKGTGMGRLVVRAVYPFKGAKSGGEEAKKRKRVSKERRERERARSAAEKGTKA